MYNYIGNMIAITGFLVILLLIGLGIDDLVKWVGGVL